MLKRIFYFGIIFISSLLSFATEDPIIQPEQSNPDEVIFTNNVTYSSSGQVRRIDQDTLRGGIKLSGIEHHFLENDEFDKKLEPFKEMLEKSISLNRSPYSLPKDTFIIPIIERGAIVHIIEENKEIQIETGGIYRCIGVAAWNNKRMGCLHYDECTDFISLRKFIDDLTDNNRLSQKTHFLLVTNYLTSNLRKMYDFLLENAQGCQILIEAQHEFGGYVLNEQSPDKVLQGRFYKASEAKQYLMPQEVKINSDLRGRSLLLKVDKSKNITYGFAVSEMTEDLEPYFLAIDAFPTGANLPPLKEVLEFRQLNISVQPLTFQTVVQKFYIHKGKQSGSLQELCYLYDELTDNSI